MNRGLRRVEESFPELVEGRVVDSPGVRELPSTGSGNGRRRIEICHGGLDTAAGGLLDQRNGRR